MCGAACSTWWPTGCSGSRAGDIMGVVSIISIAASISAMVFAGPRVYYAMARDGVFFRRAARIHPRFQTPATSIVAQAVWSGLLVLSGGANALTTYTGLLRRPVCRRSPSLALFVLRQREPDAPRPFKAIGYPVAPAIFAVACALIVANALYTDLVVPIRTGRRGARGCRPDRHRAGRAALLCLQAAVVPRRKAAFSPRRSRPGLQLWRVLTSAQIVSSASAPSLAANSRNDGGESPEHEVEEERERARAFEQRAHDPHVAAVRCGSRQGRQ